MAHENMVMKSEHSTQPKVSHKKEREYHLFGRLTQYLMNTTAVQKFLAVELEISETCILIGSTSLEGVRRLGLTRE